MKQAIAIMLGILPVGVFTLLCVAFGFLGAWLFGAGGVLLSLLPCIIAIVWIKW